LTGIVWLRSTTGPVNWSQEADMVALHCTVTNALWQGFIQFHRPLLVRVDWKAAFFCARTGGAPAASGPFVGAAAAAHAAGWHSSQVPKREPVSVLPAAAFMGEGPTELRDVRSEPMADAVS